MDFSLSPEVIEFRDEIRSIVREFVTPEIADRMHTTGVFDAPELNLELGRRGILERACPGLGKGDPIEMYVMFNELEKAGAPYDGLAVALMIAAVVNKLGTDEQKERIIPSIISGEALVCMGYSEADFGSDVRSKMAMNGSSTVQRCGPHLRRSPSGSFSLLAQTLIFPSTRDSRCSSFR